MAEALKVMDSVKEPEVLHRMDGRNVILKVKQSLDIGKMQFSFVQYGADHHATSNIDCYLSAEDFGLLMENIRSMQLQKAIAKEKANAEKEGRKYPNAIYQSPLGGSMHNGRPVSRHFTIGPGSSAEVLFTAIQSDAEKSATGAFIPKAGNSTTIRVSAKYHDLALMAYKWQWLEKDYMTKRYNMANMKSRYQPEQTDTSVPIGQPDVSAPVQEEPAEDIPEVQFE